MTALAAVATLVSFARTEPPVPTAPAPTCPRPSAASPAPEISTPFNSNSEEAPSFDTRSDNKGPEPEGVVVGEHLGRTYAVVGLERTGGIVVYDITKPTSPQFETYVNPRDFSAEYKLPDEPGDIGAAEPERARVARRRERGKRDDDGLRADWLPVLGVSGDRAAHFVAGKVANTVAVLKSRRDEPSAHLCLARGELAA